MFFHVLDNWIWWKLQMNEYFEWLINNTKKQPLKVFCKKGTLKTIAKFAGKHLLCQSFFFNNIHRERLVFNSIQNRDDWLAASDRFHMFTQSIKFCTFYYQYRCLKNVIHQIDGKNKWLVLSASFTAKAGLVFVLTLESAFS